jgi:hypothetical protein
VSPSAILNSHDWRKRAEQMRTLADDMNDLIARTAMLQIASDYDHMAERADERARNSKPAA